MADIISAADIESTDAFKKLDKFQQSLIVKRANREVLDNAFIVYKNTGYINDSLGTTQKRVLIDLIENYEKNTRK